MSAGLRKAIVLGAQGVIVPASIQDYRWQGSRYCAETNTPWVRLWADWPTLEPAQGQPNNHVWHGLDSQILTANQHGRYPIITAYRFPYWANGTSPSTNGLYGQSGTDSNGRTWWKDPRFKYPADASINGPWGQFLEKLITRYSPNNPNRTAVAYAIEICNEPNYQWWPVYAPASSGYGSPVAAYKCAELIRTAMQIKAKYGWQGALPMILAPGTADKRATIPGGPAVTLSHEWQDFKSFHSFVLGELKLMNLGVPPGNSLHFDMQPYLCWSQHNHIDMQHSLSGADTATAITRAQLNAERYNDSQGVNRAWWRAWQNPNGNDSRIFLTEGGAFGSNETNQRDRLLHNYNQMKTGSAGTGIDMLAYYLFSSDFQYDTGLRRPVPPPNGSSL